MQTISIVMSGGSAKGAYQVGFFKALSNYGLAGNVRAVSATSIGALNSYAFLSGKLEIMESLLLEIKANGIWDFRKRDKECNLLQNSFNQLVETKDRIDLDFFITLSQMSTLTPRYFNLKGEVTPLNRELIKASIAIPLLTTPGLFFENEYYFDGGVTNNIPINPILVNQSDVIIVVHFTPEYRIEKALLNSNSHIIYVDMTKIDGFIKSNFNFEYACVKKMIYDGQEYATKIFDEFFLCTGKKNRVNLVKDSYYYLSGGTLLATLNNILNSHKDQRVKILAQIKKLDLIVKK